MKGFILSAVILHFHGRAFFFPLSASSHICNGLMDIASGMSLKPYTFSIVCLICRIVTKCPESDLFVRSLSMIFCFTLRYKCRSKGVKSLHNSLTMWCCQRVCICLWEALWSLQDWCSLLPWNCSGGPKWKRLWSCWLCDLGITFGQWFLPVFKLTQLQVVVCACWWFLLFVIHFFFILFLDCE